MTILDLLVNSSLAASKGEARRLVQQGGVSLNGEKVTDIAFVINDACFTDGEATIKKGKKVFHRIVLK